MEIYNKRGRIKMHLLMARHSGLCYYCLRPVRANDASREHLKATSRGGREILENIVLAHRQCNIRMGNLPIYKKKLYRLLSMIQERILRKNFNENLRMKSNGQKEETKVTENSAHLAYQS